MESDYSGTYQPNAAFRAQALRPGRSSLLGRIALERTPLQVEDALTQLAATGATVLDAVPRPTAEGRGIFLHPRSTHGVLLELIERSPASDAAG